MYNAIIACRSGQRFHIGAHVDLTDGTALELDDRNIMAESGLGVEDAVSESDKFEVGAAIINEMTLQLNNIEGVFNEYEFKGAVFKPWIGITTKTHWRDGEIIEKIPKGVFTCNESPTVGSIISITADDNMSKFDVAYSSSTLTYPATLGKIVADACSVCGVTLATTTFPNSTYSVTERPSESSITFREMISYAAQLAGCFARCNADGELEVKWYSEPATIFDVGKYATSYDVDTTDTTITGVKIQGNDDDKTVYSTGTDEFVLRISDNPLAQDNLQSLVNTLGTKFNGFTFRAYTVSSPANPAVEAGDIVNMTDKSGVTHKTLVSHISYEYGESEQYAADAETTAENQSERFTAAEKAQETADKAQQSADEANSGVEEAKTEITQLNGEITLKADKGSLISQINICPETIKISSGKIDITGLVTISNLENGDTTIDGACIQTGKIKSQDGKWWLNLETGEVHMEKGAFSGVISWGDGTTIKKEDSDVLTINNVKSIQIDTTSGDVNIFGKNQIALVAEKVGIEGKLYANGEKGLTTQVGVTLSSGDKRTLQFTDGILTDNDA